MGLHSSRLFAETLKALQGITLLSGSGRAPLVVERYGGKGGATATPGLRLIRGTESFERVGSIKRPGWGDLLLFRSSMEIHLWSLQDPGSSLTIDEVVEKDIADVITALEGMDWQGLKADPFPITWDPMEQEDDTETEDGAVIRLVPMWYTKKGQLGLATDPTD